MWLKICGIHDVDTARQVAGLGPDAIGLNFFAGTARHVSVAAAAEIVQELPGGVEPVGVFVNHSADEIRSICEHCGLRTVQLHGDEPPELVAALGELAVIRAFRVGEEGLGPLAAELRRCLELGAVLKACLVEARVAGAFGGTGRPAPWELLRDGWREDWPPLLLAGGLTPDNVGRAIATVRPWGVDVASGVESRPGVKDVQRVAAFVRAARPPS